MRSLNFRDNVLWAIAYKVGLNPAVNLLPDQADAYVSFINAWVRRLYDPVDAPEWTQTLAFTPVNHVVPWDAHPGPIPSTPLISIGRVFKVYLVDPATSWGPVDTPFRLSDQGIHCGFDHGQRVWIKFIPDCPQYTAKVWDSGATYNKGDLSYSPIIGECYKSKINGNVGNDPARTVSVPLPTEVTQAATLNSPGLPAMSKVLTIQLAALGSGLSTSTPIPDPPPAGSSFTINVADNTGAAIATATHAGDGTSSLATILAALYATLSANPVLSAFAITTDPTQLAMTFQASQEFSLNGTYTFGLALPLTVTQQQAYIPATPPAAGAAQITKVTVTDDMVKRATNFNVAFTDALGVSHPFTYTADVNDSALQVLNGLAASLAAASAADPVLAAVQSSVDTLGKSINFITPKPAGVDAAGIPAGNSYWDLVPFPKYLVDQVVRGAYADAKKETGEAQVGLAEEQLVPTEAGAKAKTQTNEQYDPLTDQQRPKARYAVQ